MKPNVLSPLFEIVNYIAMETDIEIDFDVRCLSGYGKTITWYVGECDAPTAGDMFDYLYLDDLDEDRLNRWVSELQELVDDYHIIVDGRGIPITDCQDEDELAPLEESREEIAWAENSIQDKENRK